MLFSFLINVSSGGNDDTDARKEEEINSLQDVNEIPKATTKKMIFSKICFICLI